MIYLRAAFCFINIMLAGIGILTVQIPSLALFIPYMILERLNFTKISTILHRLFRSYIRFTEFVFGSFIVWFLWATTMSELVITGDLSVMAGQANQIVMANHQIYPDWLYMWTLARIVGKAGDVKILLMAILRYMPILGPGMMFFEFIFMERKWHLDRDRITKHLKRVINDKLPFWLLIFPEGNGILTNHVGTLNTPIGRESCEKYAKKMSITENPKIVLLPKSTGLYHCAKTLVPQIKIRKLFDVTVGYSGLKYTQVPYDEYLLEEVFLKGKYPKKIHMHIDSFNWDEVPGFIGTEMDTIDDLTKEKFSSWLRKRFMDKDELMAKFYQDHKFPSNSNSIVIKISPTWTDILGVVFLWITVYWMMPFYREAFVWSYSIIIWLVWG